MNPESVIRKVVRFHHLHDSRPVKRRFGPDQDGNYTYVVEGKARPMLVIAKKDRIWVETAEDMRERSGINECTLYRAKGRPGFLVLSLQSSPPPKNTPSIRYPNLLPSRKVSYIILRPECYPEESVAADKVESIPGPAFDQIIKEMNNSALGYFPEWHRA